jgi:hypothetical protein
MQDERLMRQLQMNESNMLRRVFTQDGEATTSFTPHSSNVPLAKKVSWEARQKIRGKGH